MAFDDYSYKYYNSVVLNPKAIKAINDDDNTSLIAADPKGGGSQYGPIREGDEDSILTSDNVRDFEKNIHYDEETAVNDFIQKDFKNDTTSIHSKANLIEEKKKDEGDHDDQ